MIEDVGLLGAIEADDLAQCAEMARQPVAAPLPGEGEQRKSLRADPFAVVAYPGRDRDRETGVARRPRDRQAMRAEIPILGHEKEQLWRSHAAKANRSGCNSASLNATPLDHRGN